jgi:hypothetical protein
MEFKQENIHKSINEEHLKSLSSTSSHEESVESPNSSPKRRNSISDFDIVGLLGKGSYAKVVLGRNIYTGDSYAIKSMDKKFIEKVSLKVNL